MIIIIIMIERNDMKVTYRNGVFETNSSSVHAIVIDTKEQSAQMIDSVSLGRYNWDNRLLASASDRASYLWTAINCLRDESKYFVDMNDDAPIYRNAIKECKERWNYVHDLDEWRKRISKGSSESIKFDVADDIRDEFGRVDYNKLTQFSNLPSDPSELLKFYVIEYYEERNSYGVDHSEGLLPLIREFYDDNKLLNDYLYGTNSYVLITNDVEDYENVFNQLILGPQLNEIIENNEERRIVDFPDKGVKIYLR